jgi:hypothetical protein
MLGKFYLFILNFSLSKMFQHIRDIHIVKNTLEIFAKLVKPRAKSQVKLRITIKMQDEIVPKENKKGKNSIFFLNPK